MYFTLTGPQTNLTNLLIIKIIPNNYSKRANSSMFLTLNKCTGLIRTLTYPI